MARGLSSAAVLAVAAVLALAAAQDCEMTLDPTIDVLGGSEQYLTVSFPGRPGTKPSDYALSGGSSDTTVLEELEYFDLVEDEGMFNFTVYMNFNKCVGDVTLSLSASIGSNKVCAGEATVKVYGACVSCGSEDDNSQSGAEDIDYKELVRDPVKKCTIKTRLLPGTSPSTEDIIPSVVKGSCLAKSVAVDNGFLAIEFEKFVTGSASIKLDWPGFTANSIFEDEEYSDVTLVAVVGDAKPVVTMMEPTGPFDPAGGETVTLSYANVGRFGAKKSDFSLTVNKAYVFEATKVTSFDCGYMVSFAVEAGSGAKLPWVASYKFKPVMDHTDGALFSYETGNCDNAKIDVTVVGGTLEKDGIHVSKCQMLELSAEVMPMGCGDVKWTLLTEEGDEKEVFHGDSFAPPTEMLMAGAMYVVKAEIVGSEYSVSYKLYVSEKSSMGMRLATPDVRSISNGVPLRLAADMRMTMGACVSGRKVNYEWIYGEQLVPATHWGQNILIAPESLKIGSHDLSLKATVEDSDLVGFATVTVNVKASDLVARINNGESAIEATAGKRITLGSVNSVDPDNVEGEDMSFEWSCESCDVSNERVFEGPILGLGEKKDVTLTVRKGDRVASSSVSIVGVNRQCPVVHAVSLKNGGGQDISPSEVPYYEHVHLNVKVDDDVAVEFRSPSLDSFRAAGHPFSIRAGHEPETEHVVDIVATHAGISCTSQLKIKSSAKQRIKTVSVMKAEGAAFDRFAVSAVAEYESPNFVFHYYLTDGVNTIPVDLSGQRTASFVVAKPGFYKVIVKMFDARSMSLVDERVSSKRITVSTGPFAVQKIAELKSLGDHMGFQAAAMEVVRSLGTEATDEDIVMVDSVVRHLMHLTERMIPHSGEKLYMTQVVNAVLRLDSSFIPSEGTLSDLVDIVEKVMLKTKDLAGEGLDDALMEALSHATRHAESARSDGSTRNRLVSNVGETNDAMAQVFERLLPLSARVAGANQLCGYVKTLARDELALKVSVACRGVDNLSLEMNGDKVTVCEGAVPVDDALIVHLASIPDFVGQDVSGEAVFDVNRLLSARVTRQREFVDVGEFAKCFKIEMRALEATQNSKLVAFERVDGDETKTFVMVDVASKTSLDGPTVSAIADRTGLFGVISARQAGGFGTTSSALNPATIGGIVVGIIGFLLVVVASSWLVATRMLSGKEDTATTAPEPASAFVERDIYGRSAYMSSQGSKVPETPVM